jgi:hypothetical protein
LSFGYTNHGALPEAIADLKVVLGLSSRGAMGTEVIFG